MNSSETLDSREDDPNPVSITTNNTNTNTRAGSSGSRNVEKKKSPSKLGTISSGMRRNSVELPLAPTAASRSRFDSIGSNASHSSLGSNSYVPYPTSSQFYDSDSNNTNSSIIFQGGRNKYPYTHLMLSSGRQNSMNRPTHERDPSDTSMLSMDSLDFPTNNEPSPSTLPYHKRKLLRSDEHGKVDESTQNNQQENNFVMNKQKVGFSDKPNTNRQDKKSNNQANQKSYRNKRPPAGLSISPGIASNSSDRNHNPPPRNLPPTGNAEHNRMRSFSADLPNSSVSRNQSVSSLSTSSFQRNNNNNNNIFNSNRSRASTTDNTVNSSSQQRKQKLSRPPMLEKRSSTVPAPPVSVSPANSVNSFQRRGQSSYRGNMGSSPTHRGTNSDVLSSLSSQLAKDVKSFFTGDSKTNKEEHQRKDSSDGSFFGGLLSSLSPSNQQTLSIEDEKQDFHQRNQKFLAKMKQQEKSTYNLPPGVSPSSSIRNNQYKRSHRTLDSIGDDDWGSDSYLDEDIDKTEKRTHRNKVPSNVDTIVSDDPHFNFDHVPDNRNKYEPNEKRNHKEKISPKSPSYLRYVDNQRTSPNNQNLSYDDDSHDYSLSSVLSSSEDDEDDTSFGDPDGEHTSLLPPTGISTHEPYTSYASTGKYKRYDDNEWQDNYYRSNRNTPTSSKKKRQGRMYEHEQRRSETRRLRDMQAKMDAKLERQRRRKRKQRKAMKGDSLSFSSTTNYQKYSSSTNENDSQFGSEEDLLYPDDYSDEYESSDSSVSFMRSGSKMFFERRMMRRAEHERDLIASWKLERRKELKEMEEYLRQSIEANRMHNRLGRWCQESYDTLHDTIARRLGKIYALFVTSFSNLPLTIGAIAMAIVTLGVVWFKFAEENIDACIPVHFHSAQCTFPEFPGCFDCDLDNYWYKLAVRFHYACSIFAGACALSFVLKVVLATKVVLDEMSSPTTSSPAGLLCMTTVVCFAGQGAIGQFLVTAAACIHLCLAFWFIYMALAFHILPDPSWYPNTVGIGLTAVKTWLYYPNAGKFLMFISLSLNMVFFPISVFRVTVNPKMSAPVGWIQMSAPNVALYALTIMAQPQFEEEHPDVTAFQRLHRMIYLPCMHFMFFLGVVGAASSVQSLVARWKNFSKKEFSPAHAAFCFPTLAHANAVQAYRGAIDAFSTIPEHTWIKIVIYVYWLIVLIFGTVTTFIITAKYFYHLPSWVLVDIEDEEEPPAPNQTLISNIIGAGESLRQNFISPVVLQANETGMLVRRRGGSDDGRGSYIRSRRVKALGFEPTMNFLELAEEREVLLEWVAKNPPRRRKHTLSVPGIDFEKMDYGYSDYIDSENQLHPLSSSRMRANTSAVDDHDPYRSSRTRSRGHFL